MSVTPRDRKIIMALVPLLLLGAYWFLLLSPKREEAAKAADALTQAQGERDTAVQQARALETAKGNYAADYAVVVKLGKAIPASVDMPSLLVQLDRAAKGAHIEFDAITPGGSTAATLPTPAQSQPPTAGSSAGAPANAGGAAAQSGPGKAAESAGNAVNNANSASSAAAQSGVSPADTQTSTTVTSGSAAPAPAAGAPGLESVPLQFQFTGSYFDLANFLHRLKRFVHLEGDRVVVKGRLMTIGQISLTAGSSTGQTGSSKIQASISATAYLSPKSQGVTAGATADGPAPGTAAPAGGTQTASSSTPPTAVVTR